MGRRDLPDTYARSPRADGLHISKPEPIMLLILPIILSTISHIFHPLFIFYSHTITYVLSYNYSTNLIVSLVQLHMIHTYMAARE